MAETQSTRSHRLTRGEPCLVDGCGRKREGRGLCSAHYQRQRKGRDLSTPVQRSYEGPCVVDSCAGDTAANGMCAMHYQRARSGADMHKPRREYQKRGKVPCAVDGCERIQNSKGYCVGHYYRVVRTGAPGSAILVSDPDNPDTWNRQVSSSGYAILTTAVGGQKVQIAEHRWIMQKHIGRELLPEENIHHLNGVRDDNRLENLQLWSSSQPSGQRAEDKADWAIELLKLYRPGALAPVEC